MVCSLSLVICLGMCGTEVWMSDVFPLADLRLR